MKRLISRLLKGVHAGEAHLAWNHPAVSCAPNSLQLVSDSFPTNGVMPSRYAGPGVGSNISTALKWSGLPDGTVEVALIMEDPDAPLPRPFVHLIAYGIDAKTTALAEGALNAGANTTLMQFGRNTFSGAGYSGPRALPGHGPHRYVFQILALNKRRSFTKQPSLKTFLNAIEGTVLARGRLDGWFEQK